MNAKQILYKALESCGMVRFYHQITLYRSEAESLVYYYEHTDSDTLICQIVRGLLFDQVPEMYQALK